MKRTPLDFDHPPEDPFPLLQAWINEAAAQSGLPNPDAMGLATVGADGRPSLRMVLMKKLDPTGVVFFTNEHSRKGIDLAANPTAALLFHWDVMERQVRIEGTVTRTTTDENDDYFASRPRQSRISAVASPQSDSVENRAELEALVEQAQQAHPGETIPRPDFWGGYRVALERIEFWQGAPSRLHDRILYTRDGDGWQVGRLAP